MNQFKPDIAFVPTGQPSPTCSPEAAFKMIFDLSPGVAVTMHGTQIENNSFKKLVLEKRPSTNIIIPETDVVNTITITK